MAAPSARLARAPVWVYSQGTTAAPVWVSMPNLMVHEVSAALQVRVKDLMIQGLTAAMAETAAAGAGAAEAAVARREMRMVEYCILIVGLVVGAGVDVCLGDD